MSDGIKLSKKKIYQTIDLNKIVGKDISSDAKLVRRIGQGIIDYMVKRVESGKGLNRQTLLSPYSESYSDSLDFKAAGKKKNDVNMDLSGDMLAAIDLTKEDGSTIEIAIDDPIQAVKAYGHQTGFKGHPNKSMSKYQREFFGVTEKEIKKYVVTEFKKEIGEASQPSKKTSTKESDKLINAIRGIRTMAEFLGDE